MKLSSQEEYGLRCALAIAARETGLTIPEISKVENLTQSHAAKLLSVLRRSGLIQSTRGQVGGYLLVRPPSEITVLDVMNALGGQLYSEDFCSRHAGKGIECTHGSDCSLRGLWTELQEAVEQVLSKTTLQDLLDKGKDDPALVTIRGFGANKANRKT